tara:strand:+ start:200 stop:1192 length:993 start_codon:yes stop_codon:yes gene_type:complete
MAKIAVLGLGNFGTALARTWLNAGHTVNGWTVEQEVFDSITASGVNEKYLAGVELTGLSVTMSLAEAMDEQEIVVLALPSGVVLHVVNDALVHLTDEQILIDLAKGLAPGDQMISEAIHAALGAAGKSNPLAVIMGPTIAPEVARGATTLAMIASEDEVLAAKLAEQLTTPTFRLEAADDPRGAEYWGAFKNVIALACGMVDGLKKTRNEGDNLKAAIFMAGYREGVLLLPKLGAQESTALGPAGIGDLFVTATSPHGRNREMGQRLGEGQSLEQATGEMVMVAEGVRATRMFAARIENMDVDAPFVSALASLLDGTGDVDDFLAAVLQH